MKLVLVNFELTLIMHHIGIYLLVCDEMDYLKLLVGIDIRAIGLYSVVLQFES